MMEIYRTETSRGVVPSAEFFIRHKNQVIQKETISLISERYELSEQWHEKFKIFVPMERDKLSEMAYTNILRLKRYSVEKLIAENQHKIAKATDEAELDQLFEVRLRLKEVEMEIARAFGNVTPR
jgi:DNA primase